MDNLILSVIGMEGQRLAGIKVGELVGKQVCESIRSSFKTDIIQKYKELSTEATKNALADPEGMKKLMTALSNTFEGMVIDKFELKSNDPNISRKTKLNQMEDNVNGQIEKVKEDAKQKWNGVFGKKPPEKTVEKTDTENPETVVMNDNPVSSVAGGGGGGGDENKVEPNTDQPIVPENTATSAANTSQKTPITNTTNISDLAEVPSIPALPDTTSTLNGAVPNIPGINLNNPLAGLPGADLINSAVQGLTPDEGVVPAYLSSALSAIDMKTKMIEGFEQFMNELTTNNSNDLKKVFLEVLKEQINAKFKEGGEFQKTIIDIIQKKCNIKFDPNPIAEASSASAASADAGVPEEPKKNPNPTDIIKSIDTNTTQILEANKEHQKLDGEKDDGTQPAEETKGGKSNKPPKRFTRKILK